MWLLLVLTLAILFSFVVFFGPPYLPTLRPQATAALELLQMKPGDTLLELGSGDGRIARIAAKQGLRVVGIEINPLLVIISRLVTWRYRKRVHIVWGSYWQVKWPPADGIFTFMIQRQMAKLDSHITAWHHKPVSLASFAFRIPGKQYQREMGGVFLYKYE